MKCNHGNIERIDWSVNRCKDCGRLISPQHPDKVCPICKTPTNLDFHYTPCPKCEYEGSTFNPLYDRSK